MTRFLRIRRHKALNDEGAVLLLAIVILAAVALAISALVTQLGTHLLVTQQVNLRADQFYAADAGLHEALDALQTEMTGTRSHCLDPIAGQQSLTSLGNFNGSALALTCKTLTGTTGDTTTLSPLDFALITTDATLLSGSMTAQSGSTSYSIKGSIFLAGPVDVRTNSGGDIDNNLIISRGEVAQQNASCTGPSTAWATRFQTTSPYMPAPVCVSFSGSDVAPIYTPVADANIFASPDTPITLSSPACKVFFPGHYSSLPSLGGTNSYFTSGNYYFDFPSSPGSASNLSVSSNVVFGAPSPIYDPGASAPCRTDAQALAALSAVGGTHPERVTGTGATVILGGTSRLSVSGNLQINARTPVPSSGEPVGLYGLRGTDGTADSRWHPWSSANGAYALSNSTGSSSLRADGAINTFDAAVSLFASGGSTVAARAGVTARWIDLKANSSALELDAFGTSGGGPPDRTILLTATATRQPGGSPQTTAQAIVRISNTAPYHTSILSWRTSGYHR